MVYFNKNDVLDNVVSKSIALKQTWDEERNGERDNAMIKIVNDFYDEFLFRKKYFKKPDAPQFKKALEDQILRNVASIKDTIEGKRSYKLPRQTQLIYESIEKSYKVIDKEIQAHRAMEIQTKIKGKEAEILKEISTQTKNANKIIQKTQVKVEWESPLSTEYNNKLDELNKGFETTVKTLGESNISTAADFVKRLGNGYEGIYDNYQNEVTKLKHGYVQEAELLSQEYIQKHRVAEIQAFAAEKNDALLNEISTQEEKAKRTMQADPSNKESQLKTPYLKEIETLSANFKMQAKKLGEKHKNNAQRDVTLFGEEYEGIKDGCTLAFDALKDKYLKEKNKIVESFRNASADDAALETNKNTVFFVISRAQLDLKKRFGNTNDSKYKLLETLYTKASEATNQEALKEVAQEIVQTLSQPRKNRFSFGWFNPFTAKYAETTSATRLFKDMVKGTTTKKFMKLAFGEDDSADLNSVKKIQSHVKNTFHPDGKHKNVEEQDSTPPPSQSSKP